MWKKLSALLFEEEDEIFEEEVLEQPKKEVKKAKVEILATPVEKELLDTQEDREDVVEKTSSFGLEIDQELPVYKDEPIIRKVYEFHPVISPIFGVTESPIHDTIPKVVEPVPATLPKSVINTVISPIYGDLETKNDEVEYKGLSQNTKEVILESSSSIKDVEIVKNVEPIQDTSPVEVLSFDDYEDIDLDDLIQSAQTSAKKTEVLSDDAHQYSLFDEDKA